MTEETEHAYIQEIIQEYSQQDQTDEIACCKGHMELPI